MIVITRAVNDTRWWRQRPCDGKEEDVVVREGKLKYGEGERVLG